MKSEFEIVKKLLRNAKVEQEKNLLKVTVTVPLAWQMIATAAGHANVWEWIEWCLETLNYSLAEWYAFYNQELSQSAVAIRMVNHAYLLERYPGPFYIDDNDTNIITQEEFGKVLEKWVDNSDVDYVGQFDAHNQCHRKVFAAAWVNDADGVRQQMKALCAVDKEFTG